MFVGLYLPQQHVLTLPNLTCTQLIHRACPLLVLPRVNAKGLVALLCVFCGHRQISFPHLLQSHYLLLFESICKVPGSPYFNKITGEQPQGTTKSKRSLFRPCHSSPIEKRTLNGFVNDSAVSVANCWVTLSRVSIGRCYSLSSAWWVRYWRIEKHPRLNMLIT